MTHMPSQTLAVDVVLLLPDDIEDLAIRLNHSFPDSEKEHFVLDKKSCIPHITLLMGLIREDQLFEASQALESLAHEFSRLQLTITEAVQVMRRDNKILSLLNIEKSKELIDLHEAVIEKMKPFFTYEGVQTDMFFMPPEMTKVPEFWSRDMARTSIHDKYDPHITIGLGEVAPLTTPITFTATTLALGHSGNHCTCRKVLWRGELK